MKILKRKEKFQIEILGIEDILKVQEFELTTNPGILTHGDIIKDLETLYTLNDICLTSDLLYQLKYNSKDSFFEKKYGYKDNLYFLKKGLWLIDGCANFDYVGLSQVKYWPDGQIVSSEGPNSNYLLQSWLQGKPEYENLKYSIITIDPQNIFFNKVI